MQPNFLLLKIMLHIQQLDRLSQSDQDGTLPYNGFDANAEEEIFALAKTMSSNLEDPQLLRRYLTNISDVPGVLPYHTNSDENVNAKLNPENPDFDSKYWVKNLRKLQDSDPDYYKPSSLGVAYRNLRVYGIASGSDYRSTVSNAFIKFTTEIIRGFRKNDPSIYFDILKTMDAVMRPGEVTVVLGRPGAGCSTLLRTIAARTYGFKVGEDSKITYDGLTPKQIENNHRGDVIYSAEIDTHFPHLLVGDTLEFAARLRTPHNRGAVERETYAKHMASVFMATFGLSHTRNTKVGNDFVRGVSGGERKRVSIAEASLSGANIQCWDNATRGLDSATALEFIKALKTSASILDTTPLIAIYQCSEHAYSLFDNVLLLYEGYQIYFGKSCKAKEFFVEMGYECPQRQTTADFLTSLTSPAERITRLGFENKVPRTAQEFEMYWRKSQVYAALIEEIENYFNVCKDDNVKERYINSHVSKQSNYLPAKSPFTVSFFMQVRYLMGRNFLRTKGDPTVTIVSILSQAIMGLILSSLFYNMKSTTESFYYRGSSLFFAVLFNAFASLLEIFASFEGRPIVSKHRQFSLYTPSADALAGIVTELPVKFFMSMAFNITFYFMTNLRREPGRFFFYWLTCFLCTLVMSHIFRFLAAIGSSLELTMTPATAVLFAMIMFTGFAIRIPNMLGWSRWINYINPLAYVFENIMSNEFSNREFDCSVYIPNGSGYDNVSEFSRICNAVGSKPGSTIVNGSDYIGLSFQYYDSHKWRNFGITVGFVLFFLGLLLLALELLNKGAMQKGEVALFLRGSRKDHNLDRIINDIESVTGNEKVPYHESTKSALDNSNSSSSNKVATNLSPESTQESVFHWKDLTYEVKLKAENRIILNEIDGWVKPGQLTALMGSSGAGKTTLLNCLSERLTTGVITNGIRMVNGKKLDSSFPRSMGYAPQQDLHLPTTTVREAMRFSAYLRQSRSISTNEKDDYVEYIIDLLEMNEYADSIVGITGEGLNVEQRKRLTIGVELAAKPKLLLFLDEPTSGLDSQTAWSICKLLRKLADNGQAILCTIHQPSAILLQEFDRLLFLQKGGQTVYFGDLGPNCSTLIDYFESHGSHPCPYNANPAEWMLEVVGAAPGSKSNQDYYEVWRNSEEYGKVKNELQIMELELSRLPELEDPDSNLKYAASIWKQYLLVTKRVFVQNWRTPVYIYSKVLLVVGVALLNGFTFFKTGRSQQDLQNLMFSTFVGFIVLNTLIFQMLPHFVSQRDLYEAKEAPSRTFSWFAFITAQITSEIPYQVFVGTLAFFCWYYPVGLYRNAMITNAVHERGFLMWLLMCSFYVYASTFGQLCISFNELADNGFTLAMTLFQMCLNFCGVMVDPKHFPHFWIFMYRLSPMTYYVQAVLATGLANTNIVCAPDEILTFQPDNSQACGTYMKDFIDTSGGYLLNPNSRTNCEFCSLNSSNTYLASINTFYSQRWSNFGIFVAFIGINIILTTLFYWLARVPKGNREKSKVE